jgi:hypothetical protein
MKHTPFETELRNPGHDDRWTCPSCYQDMPNKTQGTLVCPNCKFTIECSIEQQSVCVAKLMTEDDV